MTTNPGSPSPQSPGKTLCVKAFGVGGAGNSMIRQLAGLNLAGLSFCALNTDGQALAAMPMETQLLGSKSTRGLSAGGDLQRGQAAAEEDAARLKELCRGADMVFIFCGLGGGTGGGASPVLARLARESGALVLAFATLPFAFEGSRRQTQAKAGLEELKKQADGVICLPNEKLTRLLDEQTSLIETFQIANGLLGQGVLGIWRLLMQRGLIHVDFADLCSVARGRHGASSFATAEACGPNRAREVVEKLLANPLLDHGQNLAEAEMVLVSLCAGSDLTMAEVNRVMEQINRQAENAQVVMGATIDGQLADKLSLTVVVSPRATLEPGAPTAAPASRFETKSAPAADLEVESTFLNTTSAGPRPAPRFVPPPPAQPPDKQPPLVTQPGNGARPRKRAAMRQEQLPLEIVSKGRFDKSEPTIHHGEDLDLPTYIRRGVALN